MNVVILSGTLSRAPEAHILPSGDRLGRFEVTVREAGHDATSVPVVWFEPSDRALALADGTQVVVTGRVRRRFFRTAAGTGSRTEVVAARIVPASQRKRVLGALDAAIAQLEPAGAP